MEQSKQRTLHIQGLLIYLLKLIAAVLQQLDMENSKTMMIAHFGIKMEIINPKNDL